MLSTPRAGTDNGVRSDFYDERNADSLRVRFFAKGNEEFTRACRNLAQQQVIRVISRFLIRMIRGYQKYISPGLPPMCRFMPTCSQYAIEAITKYGPIKGTAKAAFRILRCNPLCKGGYDPVK